MTEYPVDTLAQMALIPEDRIERFLAEFPEILRQMRWAGQFNGHLKTMIDVEVMSAGVIWVDDGERNRTITITSQNAAGEAEELFSMTAKGAA